MSILTEKEVNAAWEDACTADPTGAQQRFKLTSAIESAVLEKLAGMKLPEPEIKACQYKWSNGRAELHPTPVTGYTADQLHQAYAQGAASVLSAEPVAWFDVCMESAYTEKELDCGPVDGLTPLYTLKTIE